MWRRTFAVVVTVLAADAAWHIYRAHASEAEPTLPIPGVSLENLCEDLVAGRPAAFVDVREPQEFAEEHIPGALNMTIREMEGRAAVELANAERVVPYCLKDFRGFEGARRLRQLGVRGVHVMQDVGISGWKAAGFPTAGTQAGRSETEAQGALAERCGDPGA